MDNTILQQFGLLGNVWQPFLLCLSAAGYAIWYALDWRYGGKIERLENEIENLKSSKRPGSIEVIEPLSRLALVEKDETAVPAAMETSRNFLPSRVNCAFLMSETAGKTALQAKRILAPYIGGWMRVEGVVSGVSSSSDKSATISMLIKMSDPGFEKWSMLHLFIENPGPELEFLHYGDSLTAIGKLSGVDPLGVSISSAEIELHNQEAFTTVSQAKPIPPNNRI